MRLKDKCIIVTGSTTGIGEAIARRCVAEGARVLLHGLERELGEKVLAELAPKAHLLINDISHSDSPGEIVDAAMLAFGRIDAIVNNAATVARSNLENTDAATFDRIIHTNLRAPLLLVRAAIAHLKQSRGAVLNIGSVNAYCGERNLLAYSISKGGLMTMTRNLADALGVDQVRVNQMNLGWVLTPNEKRLKIAEGFPEDWHMRPSPDHSPAGRLIMPEEVAAAAVYWLSDESRPISGSVFELCQYPIIGRNPPKQM
jgi:NAD(P)-dependent dehydrogenase (short-subunit alcohol dehydrogenase family)